MQNFNCSAVGIIDFELKRYESMEMNSRAVISQMPYMYFDLASLTKPLTLSSTYLQNKKNFSSKLLLLLNHCGGLPAGGRIGGKNWKDQILDYKIKKSETLYSDFSALRLMIELEKSFGVSLYSLCSSTWDKELCHWEKLPNDSYSPKTGWRKNRSIQGVVHDDNAFNIGGELSHAGLFGTIRGVCQSLLNLEDKVSLISFMDNAFDQKEKKDRFLFGWDTVSSQEKTLAGLGCSSKTFGHLGFTGTSMWIDCKQKRGVVILTNETQGYWYMREHLNKFRKEVGRMAWSMPMN